MKRAQLILIWIIGILFIIVGFLKYIDLDEMSKSIFDRANYPKWFFYVVATFELAGGLLLLMTSTATKRWGSIMIAVVMLGALGTHYMLKDHYTHFVVPAIIFLLAVLMSLNFNQKTR